MKTELTQLGDICSLAYGESLPDSTRTLGNVPVYGSNGIVGKHNVSVTDSETIIIGRKGSVGKINYSSVPCFPIDTTYYIDKSKTDCDLRWLYYTLSALGLEKLNKAAAVPGLNREDAYRKQLLLPSLNEQKRIAAILDKADRLRRQRRFTQTLSDSFLQSVFIKMFGDPLSNSMNWNFTDLGLQLKNIDSGNSPVCEEFRRKHIEWAVLRLSAVTSGRFLPNENKILPSNVKPNPNYEVKTGDVLFTRKNTEDLVAACALVYEAPPKLLLPDTIFRFKLKDDSKMKNEFLWSLFNERKFRKAVQSMATGSAGSMPNISKDKLNSLQIPLPPLPLQEKFAEIVQKFERVRRQQREATRQAEHLFQTLLHRAFRGEL